MLSSSSSSSNLLPAAQMPCRQMYCLSPQHSTFACRVPGTAWCLACGGNKPVILRVFVIKSRHESYLYTHTHTHVYICVCVYVHSYPHTSPFLLRTQPASAVPPHHSPVLIPAAATARAARCTASERSASPAGPAAARAAASSASNRLPAAALVGCRRRRKVHVSQAGCMCARREKGWGVGTHTCTTHERGWGVGTRTCTSHVQPQGQGMGARAAATAAVPRLSKLEASPHRKLHRC